MRYALCPMHVGYLMLLRKAISCFQFTISRLISRLINNPSGDPISLFSKERLTI